MNESEYRGPGELTSAIGEGTKGAVVGGTVGMTAGALLHQSETVKKFVGDATQRVATNEVVSNVTSKVSNGAHTAASNIRANGFVQDVTKNARNLATDVSTRMNGHLPQINVTLPKAGTTGRAALVTGAVVATTAGVMGLANGWGRASQARKSWVETVEGRSGGQISR